MKRVLIALDYDPTAQKVAETGFSLAKTMNAEITLLHVVSDPLYYSLTSYSPIMGFARNMDADSQLFETEEGIRKAAQHFLDQAKLYLDEKTIQTIIKEGDFAKAILKAANDIRAEVIVMGSHSRRWLEEILMGSVTEKVLKQTTIPLFIVPTRKPGKVNQDKIFEAVSIKDS